MKKINKVLVVTSSVLGVIVLLMGGTFLGLMCNSWLYKIPKQDEKITNNTGLIQVKDRSLYDTNGDKIRLEGVNIGNMFLQEGWLSPFDNAPKKDESNNYIKDKDGNLTYDSFTEEDFRNGLTTNPNLKTHDFNELKELYYYNFMNENDFKFIKNDLKLNSIRVPFYYKDILNDDLSLKSEKDAFKYLDYLLSYCKKYDLYMVLDLHGAPGSQNGYEHSGDMSQGASLWTNENYINATINLWDYVSNYYTNVNKELGKYIATYDILNEPTETYGGVTTKVCWEVFDKIYDTIRQNNDNHVITMEGCWDFGTLPNPKDYNWENVQYEYHWYNFINVPYDLYYAYLDMSNIGRNYNVPVLLGEFTYFEDKDEWKRGLDLFKKRNYSYTVWTYKAITIGWWDTSWGVLSLPLNLDVKKEETKININTCTYEEYKKGCELMNINNPNFNKKTLHDVLKEYR